MQDWQKDVLCSKDIRADQNEHTGFRMVIRKTDASNRMSVPEVVRMIKASSRKPVIMYPDDPFRGMYADRKEVLSTLMSTSEYEEYTVWLAEAMMNGVI